MVFGYLIPVLLLGCSVALFCILWLLAWRQNCGTTSLHVGHDLNEAAFGTLVGVLDTLTGAAVSLLLGLICAVGAHTNIQFITMANQLHS